MNLRQKRGVSPLLFDNQFITFVLSKILIQTKLNVVGTYDQQQLFKNATMINTHNRYL